MSTTRPVFYVSDGTGITAETIGHSLLTQFTDTRFVTDRIPFVDSPERAREVAERIRRRRRDPWRPPDRGQFLRGPDHQRWCSPRAGR